MPGVRITGVLPINVTVAPGKAEPRDFHTDYILT
jgi:hypothetical protein